MTHRWPVVFAFGMFACGSSEPVPLADMNLWQPASSPLWGSRPNCPAEDLSTEDLGGELSLEIRTERCAFVTVGQSLLADVRAGDTLDLRVWHFALTPQEAASATIAVALAGQEQFRQVESLPADSRLIAESSVATVDAAAGEMILFHLENHGTNSYHLLEISRR